MLIMIAHYVGLFSFDLSETFEAPTTSVPVLMIAHYVGLFSFYDVPVTPDVPVEPEQP